MLQTMTRRTWLLVMIAALLLVLPVSAQDGGALTSGLTITGELDDVNLIQVYTIEANAGAVLTLTASNAIGVPLALVVTSADGAGVASVVDNDVDGTVTLAPFALPETGIYYVTVFKSAGVASVSRVQFSLLAQIDSAGTPAPDVTEEPAPEVTEIPTEPAEVTPEVTDVLPPPPATFTTGQVITNTGMSFALTWDTIDDLDLEVRDPVGGSLYWETPTVDSGGTLSQNINQQCAVTTDQAPTETATWSPGGVSTGSYELLVYYQEACAGGSPVTFTINTLFDGQPVEPIRGTLLPGQVFVASVRVNADATVAFTGLSGVVTDELPAGAAEIIANAVPIALGSTVEGVITSPQPFDAYSFQGTANELVSISMSAVSGSLDTFLFLLDASGSIIALNDDIDFGITDSEIVNVLLPFTGNYTIVATRYAKRVGGTEGGYALTLSGQTAQLPEEFAVLPRGPLEVRLIWNNQTDVQLLVRDPAGQVVYDDTPVIRSGGTLAADGNVNCEIVEGTPFSYIYWPSNTPPRPGTYEVEVWFQSVCNDATPVTANLFISYNGREVFNDTIQPLPDERYLTSFTLTADGSFEESDSGIIRGLEDIDFLPLLEGATQIASGDQRSGAISQNNKFDLYVFNGAVGDVVSIGMTATSGSLDPLLYLVGPFGNLAGQNDDILPGENINSLIADLTLPANGQYIIIATHFGGLYGGTTGTYALTLTNTNP